MFDTYEDWIDQHQSIQDNPKIVMFYHQMIAFFYHLMMHENLVYNFDYMDDFILADQKMKQYVGNQAYQAYQAASFVLVDAYQNYQRYYLQYDNKDGCVCSLQELHELMRSYQKAHAFTKDEMKNLLAPILDAMILEYESIQK